MRRDGRLLRAVTWNLERKNPERRLGRSAMARLFSWDPDVVVVTESRTNAPARDGNWWWPASRADSRFHPDERKVGVWTRHPAESIDLGSDAPDPSRTVAIRLRDPELVVLGVCILWHFAGVRAGTDTLWEQHLRYLEQLAPILSAQDTPVVVAGDFNQRLPRAPRAAKRPAEVLAATFAGLQIPTAGVLPGVDREGIDHIAVSPELEVVDAWGWPAAEDGRRHSDHDGAGADLRLA